MTTTVTATEFQTRAGKYIDNAAKEPIYITKHNRTFRVLIDFDEYNRLKAYDTREAFYPHELDDELKVELEKGYQGPSRPELDHLMD